MQQEKLKSCAWAAWLLAGEPFSLVVENCYVVLYNSCVKILRMNKGMRLKGQRNYGKRDNERCAVLGAEGRGGH